MGFSPKGSSGTGDQWRPNFFPFMNPFAPAKTQTKTPGITPAPVTPGLAESGTVSRRASQRYGQSLASTAAPGLQAPSDTFSLLG